MKRDSEIAAGVFSSIIAGIITEFINKDCISEQYIITKTTTGFSIDTICEYNFWKTILSLFGVFLVSWLIIYLLIRIAIPVINRLIKITRIPKQKRKTTKEIIEGYFSIKNKYIVYKKYINDLCPLNSSSKLIYFIDLCNIINILYDTLNQISLNNSSAILRESNSIDNVDKYITVYDCVALLDDIEGTLGLFPCNDNNFKKDISESQNRIKALKKKLNRKFE